jgi:hypothetical protein
MENNKDTTLSPILNNNKNSKIPTSSNLSNKNKQFIKQPIETIPEQTNNNKENISIINTPIIDDKNNLSVKNIASVNEKETIIKNNKIEEIIRNVFEIKQVNNIDKKLNKIVNNIENKNEKLKQIIDIVNLNKDEKEKITIDEIKEYFFKQRQETNTLNPELYKKKSEQFVSNLVDDLIKNYNTENYHTYKTEKKYELLNNQFPKENTENKFDSNVDQIFNLNEKQNQSSDIILNQNNKETVPIDNISYTEDKSDTPIDSSFIKPEKTLQERNSLYVQIEKETPTSFYYDKEEKKDFPEAIINPKIEEIKDEEILPNPKNFKKTDFSDKAESYGKQNIFNAKNNKKLTDGSFKEEDYSKTNLPEKENENINEEFISEKLKLKKELYNPKKAIVENNIITEESTVTLENYDITKTENKKDEISIKKISKQNDQRTFLNHQSIPSEKKTERERENEQKSILSDILNNLNNKSKNFAKETKYVEINNERDTIQDFDNNKYQRMFIKEKSKIKLQRSFFMENPFEGIGQIIVQNPSKLYLTESIPFQFTPTIGAQQIATNYIPEKILNRIGEINTFTGVGSMTLQVTAQYYALSDDVYNKLVNSTDLYFNESVTAEQLFLESPEETIRKQQELFYTVWSQGKVDSLMNSLRALQFPYIKENSDYLKPPPVIMIDFGYYSNILKKPTYLNYGFKKAGSALMTNRTFIVRSVSINQDLQNKFPLRWFFPSLPLSKSVICTGFEVTLDLIEVELNLYKIPPSFEDYYNFRRIISVPDMANNTVFNPINWWSKT